MKHHFGFCIIYGLLFCTFYCNSEKFKEISEDYSKGLKAYKNKDLTNAELHFKESNSNENNLVSFVMLGKTQFYQGKIDEAINTLEEGRALYPENSTLVYWLARCYMLSDNNKARELFEKILELDENHFESLYYLAKFYEGKGNIKEALFYYNRALVIKNQFDKIHKDLAQMYERAGMKDRALNELNNISEK